MSDYIRISVEIDWWNIRSWFKRTFWWRFFPKQFIGTYDPLDIPLVCVETMIIHRLNQRLRRGYLSELGPFTVQPHE